MPERKMDRSREIFAAAQTLLPGGVDSPVRSFRGVGGDPVIIASGNASHLTDVDGNTYIDFCSSWGPLILGHAHPAVLEAVREAAGNGLTIGAATEAEGELARIVVDSVP
jgi:glutamate-1-semialdehyde 2,1-aminomutase